MWCKSRQAMKQRFPALMLRYMFPPTGFWSIYNMFKAEGNAQERINLLQDISDKKSCDFAAKWAEEVKEKPVYTYSKPPHH